MPTNRKREGRCGHAWKRREEEQIFSLAQQASAFEYAMSTKKGKCFPASLFHFQHPNAVVSNRVPSTDGIFPKLAHKARGVDKV
jgi:hypothetical protein